MGAILGIIFHGLGGFGAGSFYIPFKQVKKWSWESSWLVLGVMAWVVAPLVMASITVPNLVEVLSSAPTATKFWTYFFGILWGIGGLTFGLSMRYLGVSLGMTIALGFCTAFGTLIPPLFHGNFGDLISTQTGQITFAGILLCLLGIAIVGRAGFMKEKQMNSQVANTSIKEFNLMKGLAVAVTSGILSACFAFGLEAGGSISDLAVSQGANELFRNNAVLVWILWGGITTNSIYCIILNFRNKSHKDYGNSGTPLVANYLWASLGGITWYLQFFFYGMGTTYLGEKYDFASWSIHMAFIIFFSNFWGIYYKEWKGVTKNTSLVLGAGLFVILLSVVLIGMANTLSH
ncbi:MAG: L-rhamnose/proton symporter RhaT [Cyclobacteriaceae bacterium]